MNDNDTDWPEDWFEEPKREVKKPKSLGDKMRMWNEIERHRETIKDLLTDISNILPKERGLAFGAEVQTLIKSMWIFLQEVDTRTERIFKTRAFPAPRDKPEKRGGWIIGPVLDYLESHSFQRVEDGYQTVREHLHNALTNTVHLQAKIQERSADLGGLLDAGDFVRSTHLQEWMDKEFEKIRGLLSYTEDALGID
jgi:hypothetical protein